MKELLLAKRIDLTLQLLALLIPFAWAVAAQEMFIVLAAYFSVGGVQVLSCLLNKIGWPRHLKHDGRRWYERLLLLVLVVEGAALLLLAVAEYESSFRSFLQVVLCALPFVSPFMAIWYMGMTREELVMVRRLSQRRVI